MVESMPPTDFLSQNDLDALAAPVRDIAIRAGQAILEVASRGYDVKAKEDRTPVTDADHAAEGIILAALGELTPSFDIISEEAASRGESAPIGEGPAWVVDPLDGTREFVDGGDEYAICIGLLVDRKPVFGLLHGPALDVTYWTAGANTGFKAEGDGAGAAVTPRAWPAAGPTAITSRFHSKTGRLAAYLDEIAPAMRINMSSALKFGLLAEGAADIYPRFGPTCEWDTAAGHAVLAAVGGTVCTLDGAELTYGKPDYLNPGFIARGMPA
ncbi:MAG: 3'(2'),5'-bisphosphate nucleotidase CysQ [Alphaproteobacteria bacterium]|nr:3'(2'),5'-bisphosphate nucleotidase CysQ [Alphaproteobacteria bacterium]